MNSFEVKNLCAGYGRCEVLHDISLAISSGCITAITGLNASGKSTLLKCMANQMAPFSGACLFDGVPVRSFKPACLAKKIAFCTQKHPDCGYLTVREVVEMGRFSYRESRKATSSAADEAMALTGVADSAGCRMSALSPGVQQRVWIALALAQQPEMLLLDEPSNFLDPAGKQALGKLLVELRNSRNITILFVTHDLELAVNYSDDVIALKDGALLMCGKTADIINKKAVREIYGIEYHLVALA